MQHIKMIPEELRLRTTVSLQSLLDDVDAFHRIIDHYGFVVVTDILSPTEIQQAESLFDQDIFSIVDLPTNIKKSQNCFREAKRDDGSALSVARRWPMTHFPLGRRIPTFASDFGLPQGQAAWYCRRHPNMTVLFQSLYQPRGTKNTNQTVDEAQEEREEEAEEEDYKDLCVGLDNPFVDNSRVDLSLPSEERKDYLWPHADQNPYGPNGTRTCYQSVLYLWESHELTSTTVVWPESHRLVYPAMMERMPTGGKSHYCQLPVEQEEEFAQSAVRVIVPPGGAVIWNSRTIHQGWNEGPRLAFPVCMEPRARRSAEALARKRDACRNGLPTTHWASLGIVHMSATAQSGGTKQFPMITAAHRWLLVGPRGDTIDPTVEAFL